MTFPAGSTNLLSLPAEVLLIILGDLHDIRHFPGTAFRSICGLLAISAVNRRLRLLCLPTLFKTTRCTSAERLRQLTAECTVNPQFTSLIKQLDVVEVDTRDILPELLPSLTALARLDVQGNKVDARLLVVVNSHPTLTTVAVRDAQLKSLTNLLSSTDLPFSKILVSTITVNRDFIPKSDAFRAVVQRGARFANLNLQGQDGLDNAGATLPVLPDLEQLEFEVCRYTNGVAIQTWLLDFAQRHTHLTTIKFIDRYSLYWRDSSDLPFAAEFQKAALVGMTSFSITRPVSWTCLKDWDIVHLALRLSQVRQISTLWQVAELAPRLLSLDLVLVRYCNWPVHIDEFAQPFGSVPSLRTLHLTNLYAHLNAGSGRSPWIRSSTPGATRDVLGTSACVTALNALLWYTARIVEQAPALDLIHVTDDGMDGTKRSRTPWTLQASFGVRPNEARDLELLGTPKLEMAPRYLPKK